MGKRTGDAGGYADSKVRVSATTGSAEGEPLGAEIDALRASVSGRIGQMATLAAMVDSADRSYKAASGSYSDVLAAKKTSERARSAAGNIQRRVSAEKTRFEEAIKKDVFEIYDKGGVLTLADVAAWLRVTLAEDVVDDWLADRRIADRITAIQALADYTGKLMLVDTSYGVTGNPSIHDIAPSESSALEFKFDSPDRLRLALKDSNNQEVHIPIATADINERVIRGEHDICKWLSEKLAEIEQDINEPYSRFLKNSRMTVGLVVMMGEILTSEADGARIKEVEDRLATELGSAIRRNNTEHIQYAISTLKMMPKKWQEFDYSIARDLAVWGRVTDPNNSPDTTKQRAAFMAEYCKAVLMVESEASGKPVNYITELPVRMNDYLERGKKILEAESTGNA
jgi:hypothetical protein